jgi:hypothetical protein
VTQGTIDLRDGHGAVTAGLVEKYSGTLPTNAVEEVVRSVWDDLAAGARFVTYLPVLARRLADERLRDLAAQRV